MLWYTILKLNSFEKTLHFINTIKRDLFLDRFGSENEDEAVALNDDTYHSKYGFHGLEENPYIYPSLYADNVKKYIKVFGEENIKVIFFEELIKNQKKVIQEILEWLNIESDISKINLEESEII